MKRIKGIATILMVACMLVSCFMFNSTYAFADTASVAPATPAEKIDATIWDTIPDENGRYLVYISRDSISDKSIENEFNKRNEFDLSDYKDKKTFRWEIGSSIAMNAFEKYGMRETFDIKVGRKLFNDELVPIEYEFIEYYNGYLESKRQVISDLYEDYNKSFVEDCLLDEDAILYEGIYTGSYMLYATQGEIEDLSKDESVKYIMACENPEAQSDTNLVHSQIGTDSLDGTKSTNFNTGKGYKGTGIKIGIIEACEIDLLNNNVSYKTFDKNSPQFSSIFNKKLFYVDKNGQISNYTYSGNHANLITSIIVGQQYHHDLDFYEGVVPCATVYQTTRNEISEIMDGIQDLIYLYNVNVINCSLGITLYKGQYSCYDFEIDHLIRTTSVSFVKSAGNYNSIKNPNREITSPGLGYNVITVGALYTKDNASELVEDYLFGIECDSAFNELNYLTNKPDLVAPGNCIACWTSNGELVGTGTSAAAAFVTGVVAQLFQADESLMDSPTKTKAILLAGADPTVLSMTFDGQPAYAGSELIFEKYGAGMLNARNSINIATHGNYNNIALFLDSTSVVGDHYIDEIELNAGDTIRIVLTYNKPDSYELEYGDTPNANFIPTTGYQNDAGLKLYKGSEPLVTSNFIYSNVEIIEYTAVNNGIYTIKAFAQKYTRTQDMIPWVIAVAWDIVDR